MNNLFQSMGQRLIEARQVQAMQHVKKYMEDRKLEDEEPIQVNR